MFTSIQQIKDICPDKMVAVWPMRYYNEIYSGRGAVWLARMTGGHEVAGSSPVAPIL